MFPRTPSPPDDDRDKTDAASSSRPSAEVDPGGSTCDTVCSRPGLELEELLEAKTPLLLHFRFLRLAHLSVLEQPTPSNQSPSRVGPAVAHSATVESGTTRAIKTREMIIVVAL